jgi:photosystem II PsbJ protein
LFWLFYFQVISLIKFYQEKVFMAGTGRIPLWLIALVGGLAVIAVLALFIYGSYSGLGSSL